MLYTKIIEELRNLSEEDASEVLDFILFLKTKDNIRTKSNPEIEETIDTNNERMSDGHINDSGKKPLLGSIIEIYDDAVGKLDSQVLRVTAFAAVIVLFLLLIVPRFITYIKPGIEGLYCCDSSIYFGIGRGMNNGYKLYRDLFDTKPPAIFYLTKLSCMLTGSFYLAGICSFLAVMTVSVVPAIFLCVKAYNPKDRLKSIATMIMVSSPLLLFSVYSQSRGGFVQTEAFGAAFIVLYMICIANMKYSDMKPYSLQVIFAAIVLMMGPMFKEPFAMIAFATGILYVKTLKDFIYKIFFPFAWGGIFGCILMLINGDLTSYIGIYLKYLLFTEYGGSLLGNSFHFNSLLGDLWKYNAFALIIVLTSAIVVIVHSIRIFQKNAFRSIISIALVFVGFWITSAVVNVKGYVFEHYYAFALPFYVALYFRAASIVMNNIKKKQSNNNSRFELLIPILAFLMTIIAFRNLNSYIAGLYSFSENMQEDARYVDNVLDTLGEENYQYFGFNGECIYIYTNHSPMGPEFIQDYTKVGMGTERGEVVLEQLSASNIVVIQDLNCGDMNDYINDILEKEFTDAPPPGIIPREDMTVKILYRKNAF